LAWARAVIADPRRPGRVKAGLGEAAAVLRAEQAAPAEREHLPLQQLAGADIRPCGPADAEVTDLGFHHGLDEVPQVAVLDDDAGQHLVGRGAGVVPAAADEQEVRSLLTSLPSMLADRDGAVNLFILRPIIAGTARGGAPERRDDDAERTVRPSVIVSCTTCATCGLELEESSAADHFAASS
jgi:hypothetical protein